MPNDTLNVAQFDEQIRLGMIPLAMENYFRRVHPYLDHEIKDVRNLCRRFVDDVLQPLSTELELQFEAGQIHLAPALLNALNEHHFFSLWIPKIFGGRGYHPLSLNVFNEFIGSYCLGTANIVGAHYVAFTLLTMTQNLNLSYQIGQAIVAGEKNNVPCILSAAITEPSAGSDKEDYRLLARSKAGSWAHRLENGNVILSGSKIFISNAPWASYHIVVTTESPETPEKNAVVLVIPKGTPGLNVGAPEIKMGQHACPASLLYFDQCLIEKKWIALANTIDLSQKEYAQFSELINQSLLAMTRSGVATLSSGALAAVTRQVSSCFSRSLEGTVDRGTQSRQSHLGQLMAAYLQAKDHAWNTSISCFEQGFFKLLMEPKIYRSLNAVPASINKLIIRMARSSSRQTKLCRQVLEDHTLQQATNLLALASAAKLNNSNLAMSQIASAINWMGPEVFQTNHLDLFKIARDAKLLQIYEGTNQLNALHVYHEYNFLRRPVFDDSIQKDQYVSC